MINDVDRRYLDLEKDDGRMSKQRREFLLDGAMPLSSGDEFCGYLEKISDDGGYREIYEPFGNWGEEGYVLRNRVPLSLTKSD